ncbi:MAG: ABC transporter ATP-binding protein [Pseudomonadota bacterium]
MPSLQLRDISVSIGDAPLVKHASLTLEPGDLIALLGPNGAGKTSLLRGALGLAPLSSGTAALGGQDTAAMNARERARMIAYLPQIRPLAWPNKVHDVVALGRFAYGTSISKLPDADANIVADAMEKCDIAHLATRRADTLSGGESARMHCARALAAATPLLIADEPVAALDPRHQLQVMQLFAAYVAGGGGALVVLHDINLAARFATRLVWMKDGAVVADGPPADTLTPKRMASVYGVKAQVDERGVHVTEPL